LRVHAGTGELSWVIRDKRLRTADCDFEALSLKELKQLQKDVAKAIFTHKDRQKSEASATVEAIAREMGCSNAYFIGSMVKPSPATPAQKYRNPENPSLTWSGRRRKSQWFVEALIRGKAPEELAIG